MERMAWRSALFPWYSTHGKSGALQRGDGKVDRRGREAEEEVRGSQGGMPREAQRRRHGKQLCVCMGGAARHSAHQRSNSETQLVSVESGPSTR